MGTLRKDSSGTGNQAGNKDSTCIWEVHFIRSNACVGTILPRAEKHEVEPLTDDQVALLLQMTEEDEEYGILLKVILVTGVRKAEAMGITWDYVDFRRGVIRINKQLQKRPKRDGGVDFASSKTERVASCSRLRMSWN